MSLKQPITAKGYNGTVRFDGWWIQIERGGALAGLAAKVNSYESKQSRSISSSTSNEAALSPSQRICAIRRHR
jgi:hypothetical protein